MYYICKKYFKKQIWKQHKKLTAGMESSKKNECYVSNKL